MDRSGNALRPFHRRKLTRQQRRFATNSGAFKSGLEDHIAAQLAASGISPNYEGLKLKYVIPETVHHYTPDFPVTRTIVIETKGLFTSEDRKKMRFVKEQHPTLDLRMVFSNAHARINKGSPTTYAMWCEKYGFPWAHKRVPEEWITDIAKSV